MTTSTRYTLISSDTHAGANHKTYREYLDPRFQEDFDAWREKYKNPWKDLRDTDLRVRNWDDDRRDTDQHADGVVAEVGGLRTPPRRAAGAQPLARRLLRAPAGHSRGYRADLPQRRRRRDRRRD